MVVNVLQNDSKLSAARGEPVLLKGIIGGGMVALVVAGAALPMFGANLNSFLEGAIALAGAGVGAFLARRN